MTDQKTISIQISCEKPEQRSEVLKVINGHFSWRGEENPKNTPVIVAVSDLHLPTGEEIKSAPVKAYHEVDIMRAERVIDFYGGANCDEKIPEWECFSEGGMDGERDKGVISLCPTTFPAGTIIKITAPACPECGMDRHTDYQECLGEGCSFNWSGFDQKYS